MAEICNGGIIMKYGKIRIEDGNLVFARHMMMNYLPCRDILWVYKRQEGVEGWRSETDQHQLSGGCDQKTQTL